MTFCDVQSILSGQVVRAVCWTLVHSCWQGLLLALLTGLAIVGTRRSKPVVRYNILSGLLCLFFVVACGTFVYELRGAAGTVKGVAGDVKGGIAQGAEASGSGLHVVMDAVRSGWWERMGSYFNEHAALIVAIWFIVFMAKLVQLLAHLGAVQRIRHYRVQAAPEEWVERLVVLAEKLGIRRRVSLLESALVKVPMVAGIFKPVVLVPLGLLSRLAPEQVEAILLHELAHIRRKDYLVNLLFSCTEILFFFNPAVLWVASLIREEREHCCDEEAVNQTGDKRSFVDALVSFQEYSRPETVCAMAFPGSGNQLLKRVKRIVLQDNKMLELREKCFLVLCLLAGCGLTMAFVGKGERHVAAVVRPVKVDLIPLQKVDTVAPQARKEAAERAKLRQEKMQAEKRALEQAQLKLEKEAQDLAIRAEKLMQEYKENGSGDEAQKEAYERALEGQRDLQKLKFERMENDTLRLVERNIAFQKLKLEHEQLQMLKQLKFRNDTLKLQQLGSLKQAQQGLLFERKQLERSQYLYEIVAPIIEDLKQSGLVKNKEDFSFSLNKDGLIVDGVRQPESVFEGYKKKYITDAKNEFSYSVKPGKRESISVRKED